MITPVIFPLFVPLRGDVTAQSHHTKLTKYLDLISISTLIFNT